MEKTKLEGEDIANGSATKEELCEGEEPRKAGGLEDRTDER